MSICDMASYQHGCDSAIGNHNCADIEQYGTTTSVILLIYKYIYITYVISNK